MTGYTVHTGSNERYSEGWDRIFSQPTDTKGSQATPASKQPKARTKKGDAATTKSQKSSKATKST